MGTSSGGRAEVVAEIDLAPSRRVRVTIERGDDGPVVDVRVCTPLTRAAPVFIATKNGFRLRPPAALMLVEALGRALSEAQRLG